MWTGPGLFIHKLEIRTWFWASAAWPPTSCSWTSPLCILSFLWRTDAIVFSKLNKPPTLLSPTSKGLEINKPPRGLFIGFTYRIYGICSQTQLDDIPHEQTIICRQLFVCRLVGFWPMKRKKYLHRMIIGKSLHQGSSVYYGTPSCDFPPCELGQRLYALRGDKYVLKRKGDMNKY